MGTNIEKNVFLPKVIPIQLNYAFLLFWSIFREIFKEIHILVQKFNKEYRNSQKICFS